MKKLIVYFCSFLIIFNIFTYKPEATVLSQPQTYDLGVGALTMGSLLLDGGAVGAAVVASAPYVAAFATVCIGLGIIYNNREEIQASLVSVYNYAKAQGKNLLDYFSSDGDNVVISSEAISLTRGAFKDYLIDSSSLNTIGHLGTFQFASGSISNPSLTNVSFPLSGSDSIILEVTCSGLGSAYAPSAQVLLDGSNLHYFSEMFYGTSNKTFWIGLSYDSTGWNYKTSSVSLSDLLSKSPTHKGSICADLTLNVEQKWNKAGSISVDRLLGDSIGNLGNVGADVIPKNPSISGNKDVSISIPNDRPLTWDDVLYKDWTQTGDITAEDVASNTDTGTGEQTGLLGSILGAINSILDFLKDILGSILGAINSVISFLGNLLSNLINALIDMFVYLFVPSDGLFVDAFNSWKSNLEGKFGLDLGNIDNLQNIGEQGVQDITFTILGISCVLPISIVNKIAPYSRIISTGLISIFLAWYHYRNIIFLLRETAPFSGDGGGRK